MTPHRRRLGGNEVGPVVVLALDRSARLFALPEHLVLPVGLFGDRSGTGQVGLAVVDREAEEQEPVAEPAIFLRRSRCLRRPNFSRDVLRAQAPADIVAACLGVEDQRDRKRRAATLGRRLVRARGSAAASCRTRAQCAVAVGSGLSSRTLVVADMVPYPAAPACGPVRNFVLSGRIVAWKGTVPFLLTQKSGQSPACQPPEKCRIRFGQGVGCPLSAPGSRKAANVGATCRVRGTHQPQDAVVRFAHPTPNRQPP